jgi:hypothetical protein
LNGIVRATRINALSLINLQNMSMGNRPVQERRRERQRSLELSISGIHMVFVVAIVLWKLYGTAELQLK